MQSNTDVFHKGQLAPDKLSCSSEESYIKNEEDSFCVSFAFLFSFSRGSGSSFLRQHATREMSELEDMKLDNWMNEERGNFQASYRTILGQRKLQQNESTKM